MLEYRKKWARQPVSDPRPSRKLGLTALILPGQSSVDLVSGLNLSSVIGTPTPVVGSQGPALQHNANREAIYAPATAAQKSPQGSIVWAGTLTGDPSTAASLGGTTFDASNSNPYVGIAIKRRVVSARTLAVSFSYGPGAGQVKNLQTANAYTTGDVVVVGVFESGRQNIVVRSAAGIEIASDTGTGALSYGATARLEVGESLNSRNPAADTALLALSSQPWSPELAMQVANDVWGMLFEPRHIWVPVSTGGGGISGALTATLADVTSAATGTLKIAGTASATLGALTSTATGTIAIKGAASPTLASLTSTATGAVAIKGTTTATLGAATLASTGALAIKGTTTATLASVSLAATGSLQATGTGTVAATLADATLSAAGALAIKGTASTTLGALTSSATGALQIKGSTTVTLGEATLSAAGTAQDVTIGTLTATLADATLSSSGTIALNGSVGATLADVTLAATGELQGQGTGVTTATLADATVAATGKLALAGAATITLDGLAGAASGTLRIAGITTATLASLALVSRIRPTADIEPDVNSAWWTYTVEPDDLTYAVAADPLTYEIGV